jgi:Holliday junction resolvase RusA-like endonuclease
MEYTFSVEGKPRVKQRPRMTRRGKAYTPQATLDAEQTIRDAYDGPKFEGPVKVLVVYKRDEQEITIREIGWENFSKIRGDIDNLLKCTLDGLTGAAWDDDRIVKEIVAIIV